MTERRVESTPEMRFTGERYVPAVKGEIRYEHMHRYAVALDICSGKTVVDVASGEGYGSAILASVAASVVGVDIDPAAVEHARLKYGASPNLRFQVGKCDALPVAPDSVDVVVSYETIEHHDRHDEMLTEIKRVLRADGIFLVSSPNTHAYSAARSYENPYHVSELSLEDLTRRLRRSFEHVLVFGQRVLPASLIVPLDTAAVSALRPYTSAGPASIGTDAVPPVEPMYFVAIASDRQDRAAQAAERLSSVYAEAAEVPDARWAHTQEEVPRVLASLGGAGTKVIVVDDGALGRLDHHGGVLPFVERDGAYWGPPSDDAEAIAELERLRRAGATGIVFVWSTFWWLEHYVGFAAYLGRNYPCLVDDELFMAFDLRREGRQGA